MMMDEYQDRTRVTNLYPDTVESLFAKSRENWSKLPPPVREEITKVKRLLILLVVNAGLQEEAGEVSGKVKRILRDGHGDVTDPVMNTLAAELGDVMWYTSEMASMLRRELSDVARMNVEKLADRATRGKLRGQGDNR